VPGLTSDDWARIDAERERLLSGVDDFVYVGPSEFSSSDGGSSTVSLDDDEDDDGVPLINVIRNDVIENDDADVDAENIFEINNIEVHLSDDEIDIHHPQRDVNNNEDNFLLWGVVKLYGRMQMN